MNRKTTTQLVALALIIGFGKTASAQSVSVTDYDEATSAYQDSLCQRHPERGQDAW